MLGKNMEIFGTPTVVLGTNKFIYGTHMNVFGEKNMFILTIEMDKGPAPI